VIDLLGEETAAVSLFVSRASHVSKSTTPQTDRPFGRALNESHGILLARAKTDGPAGFTVQNEVCHRLGLARDEFPHLGERLGYIVRNDQDLQGKRHARPQKALIYNF
jgi:hypothetical protein